MRVLLLVAGLAAAADGLAVEAEAARVVQAAAAAEAAGSGTTAAADEAATPLAKVVTMLKDLKTQVIAEGEEEAKLFAEFSKWCDGETYGTKATIGNGKGKLSDLRAFIEEQQAMQERLQSEIDEIAGEIASTQAELDEAKGVRDKEHQEYLGIEKDFIDTIDQLARAIEVLNNPNPSFVQATKTVQKALEKLMMTPQQSASVQDFFQQTAQGAQPAAASFLQQVPYKSRTGELVITLQQLKDETTAKRQAKTKEESDLQHAFDLLKQSLQTEIDSDTKTMDLKKRDVQTSEENVAKAQSELQATNSVITEALAYLEEVGTTCDTKSREWKERTKVRSDEITAVTEAISILESEEGQASSNVEQKKRATSAAQVTAADVLRQAAAPMSFVQVGASSQVLVGQQLLAEARAAAAAGQPDPFKKVRKMINQMIQKLLTEAAEEAEHKGWCDTEMGKSEVVKTQKEKDVKKLTAMIDEMSARVEELGNEIGDLTKEIAEAEAMDLEATKVREGENKQATAAIKEYQEGQELIQRVIGVLNDFYAKQGKKAEGDDALLQGASAAAGPPKTFEGEYTGKGDAAGGIMAILEISLSDFSRLEAETKTAEQQAAAEYQKLMHESAVRKATLKKDLEYKSTEKQKLEGDIQRSSAELAGYKEELSAVLQYIEKLKPSCTNAAPSHEERKARRQKEIDGLNEALATLNNEGV